MVAIIGYVGEKDSDHILEQIRDLTSTISYQFDFTKEIVLLHDEIPLKFTAIIAWNNEYPVHEVSDNSAVIVSIPENIPSIQSDYSKGVSELLEQGNNLTQWLIANHFLSAIVYDKDGVHLVRSIDGQNPLYYSLADGIWFGTEKKPFWKMGLDPQPVMPGSITRLRANNKSETNQVDDILDGIDNMVLKDRALEELEQHLLTTFSHLKGVKRVGVLFSGGVDSSLVAHLASSFVNEVILFSANAKNARDLELVHQGANLLGLPLEDIMIEEEKLWRDIPEILFSLEISRIMDLEIGIPFFYAAKRARELGIEVMLSGQGPDELFAGYARHVSIFSKSGPEALHKELLGELRITHEANIARDHHVISHHGIAPFFPYIYRNLIERAASLPPQWKVMPNNNPERKVIFVELAKRLGLPDNLSLQPKSATQYSSGSKSVLLRVLARYGYSSQGLSLRKTREVSQAIINTLATELGIPAYGNRLDSDQVNLDEVLRYKKGVLSSRNEG